MSKVLRRRRLLRKRCVPRRRRAPPSALEAVLGGLGDARFFGEFYERRVALRHGTKASKRLARRVFGFEALLRRVAGRAREADALLVMKDQTPCALGEAYGDSISAAWLDGCSLILNHVERFDKKVHALCQALRASVPHCYANAYATPGRSKAVEAHADDRDVVVFQVRGSKRWRVYAERPVASPFADEQVGKAGIPVPPATFASPLIIDGTLRAGDALYIPRGFVHEAETTEEPSLHLTLAFATAEWSWHRIAGRGRDEAGARKAVPRHFARSVRANAAPIDAGDRAVAARFDAIIQAVNDLQDCEKTAFAQDDVDDDDDDDDIADDPRCFFVRRRRPEDPPPPEAGRGGVVARSEIADHLPAAVAAVTRDRPVAVPGGLPDAPIFCAASKVALALVCLDLGLFVQCDARGDLVVPHRS